MINLSLGIPTRRDNRQETQLPSGYIPPTVKLPKKPQGNLELRQVFWEGADGDGGWGEVSWRWSEYAEQLEEIGSHQWSNYINENNTV